MAEGVVMTVQYPEGFHCVKIAQAEQPSCIVNVEDELQRLFKAKLNSLDNSKIESPNHYTLPSGKQLIELLQSDLLTRKEFIGFCKGNVYKYVSRYQAKNHREDLEKAKQYLNFLEGLENE